MPAPIVDAHTHAFPDGLAARALAALEERSGVRPCSDGTVGGLLASMDRAGVAVSVVHPVATDPRQARAIARWAAAVAGPRIVAFASVHPRSPALAEEIAAVAAAGIPGVKLHPEYQDFHVDEPTLAGLYETLEASGLILLLHAGFDIGFPDSDRASPARILAVHRAHPGLRIVAAHLGGFRRWREVAGTLAGSGVWLESSFTLGRIEAGVLREILAVHDPRRLLFGSDSPWADQAEAVGAVRDLGLPPRAEADLLGGNALRLLRGA